MNTLIGVLVVLIQVAAGTAIWIAMLGNLVRGVFLTVGIGIALGTFLSLVTSVLLHGTILQTVAWMLPTILALAIITLRRHTFIANLRSLRVQRPELLGVLITLAIALPLLLLGWLRTPLGAIRGGASVDMYFFEALANGIAQFGPAHSILMTDGSLRYHWFAYGWAGNLSSTANLDSFIALTRFLPVLALLGAIFIGVGWASTLTLGAKNSPRWVPTLAGLLIAVGGYTGALYGGILNLDSPSQSLSTVWLLALAVVFTLYLDTQMHAFGRAHQTISLIAIAILTSATMGGKASTAAVAIAGMLLTTAVGLTLRTRWWRRSLVATTIAVVAGGATYFMVLSGVSLTDNLADATSVRAATWQQLDPLIGKWGPLIGTVGLAAAVSARFGGFLWLGTRSTNRNQPAVILTFGAVLAGVLALFALRGGINDLWFVLAASAPAAVVSAYGAGQASQWLRAHWRKGTAISPLVLAVGIGLLASTISMILSLNWTIDPETSRDSLFAWPGILFWLSAVTPWVLIPLAAAVATQLNRKKVLSRSGFFSIIALSAIALTITSIATRPAVLWTQNRPLVTDIGLVTPIQSTPESSSTGTTAVSGESLTTSQLNAATWILINSDPTDTVATSAPYSAQIPALTGRAMYLAGSNYQRGLGDATQVTEVDRRSEISRQLLTDEWATSIQAMCTSGVDLLWIEGMSPISSTHAPEESLGDVALYRTDSLCEKPRG